MRVISADSHVLEPHDLWTTRLVGTPFADRAPHMVEDGKGGHFFAVDGLSPFPIGLAGAAGKPADELKIFGNNADEWRPGGWDPGARLAATTPRRASTPCGRRSPSGACPRRSTSSPAAWAATRRSGQESC